MDMGGFGTVATAAFEGPLTQLLRGKLGPTKDKGDLGLLATAECAGPQI